MHQATDQELFELFTFRACFIAQLLEQVSRENWEVLASEMGRCCAMGCSCWLVLSRGWGFVVLIFIVMDCEMGNCFSIKKGKTTAFSVE